jgi:hypothetical protein
MPSGSDAVYIDRALGLELASVRDPSNDLFS